MSLQIAASGTATRDLGMFSACFCKKAVLCSPTLVPSKDRTLPLAPEANMYASSPHSNTANSKKYSIDWWLLSAWLPALRYALLLVVLAVPATSQTRISSLPPPVSSPPSDISIAPVGTHGSTGGGTGPITVPTPPIIIWDPGGADSPTCNTGPAENPSDVLDKKGPQLPMLYSMSSFTFTGFTKGGWPIAVDYVVPQDSLVLFVVTPEGQPSITYRLAGKAGHWIVKLAIPNSVGSELLVAHYSLQTLDGKDVPGPVAPASIYVHGVAAGPKAVGSIGIDHVVFQPGNIVKAQSQKAQYSYHSISDFDDTEVSFVRLGKSGGGEVRAAAVASKSMGNIAQDHVKNGDWDGSVDKKLVKTYKNPELQQWLQSPNGHHALQIRAWLRKNHGGDFVAAISDTLVTVQ